MKKDDKHNCLTAFHLQKRGALVAIEKSGNAAAFAKLQQDAKEIRSSKQVAYGPIARTDK